MADGINALKPLERVDVTDGVALPDEVKQIVDASLVTILARLGRLERDVQALKQENAVV